MCVRAVVERELGNYDEGGRGNKGKQCMHPSVFP